MEKTKAILAAVTVCCLMTGTPSFAMDGNQLLKLCLSHETVFEFARRRVKGPADGGILLEAGMCQGYVMGAMGTLITTKEVCPPAGIHANQAIDIVNLWLYW
jgi:Rap1a immunity proteins